MRTLIVGTRGSALALKQTGIVVSSLQKKERNLQVTVRIIKTTGDKIQDTPLSRIGLKGLFIKEIEDSLLKGEIDCAVHSLKDLPTDLPEGLYIGAVLKGEDPRDCLLSSRYKNFTELPKGAIVGTSALRRKSQILALRPDLIVKDLRGNLDTRIRKLEKGSYDAIVVSLAGLNRLYKDSFPHRLNRYLIPYSQLLPAVGQGILALEVRKSDSKVKKLVQFLNDVPSSIRARAERAFMSRLEGGCQVPIGIRTKVSGPTIVLEGMIASIDGRNWVRESVQGSSKNPESVGDRLAVQCLRSGGDKILEAIRSKK